MSAVYAILDVTIKDPAKFREYIRGHLPTLAAHGGRVLFRSDDNERVDGSWTPKLLVVQEWPSAEAFNAWHESAAYRPWKALRQEACEIDFVLAKGMRA